MEIYKNKYIGNLSEIINGNLVEEEWRKIPLFEERYECSTFGRIRSIGRLNVGKKNKTIKANILAQVEKKGKKYLRVLLYSEIGKRKLHLVHRVVAKTFLGVNNLKPEVNHKNKVRDDNRLLNLEWCTRSENTIHSFKNGRVHPNLGNIGVKSKVSKDVFQFDLNGSYIDKYYGASDAHRRTKIFASSITRCCNNKAITAGGYIWKHSNSVAIEYGLIKISSKNAN